MKNIYTFMTNNSTVTPCTMLLMKLRASYQGFVCIGLGHLLYAAFNWFFDHVVYVYAVFTWGMLLGGGIMALLSLIQCALTLRLYEKMQIDWVGAAALDAFIAKQPASFLGRLFGRVSKNRKVVFVFLCLFSDPFITTAYFRKGRFDGLTAQDWRTFLYSVLLSNGYWICICALLGNAIDTLWHWLDIHKDLTVYFYPL